MERILNSKTAARAGSLYLNMIITGIFAHLLVRASLIVPGEPSITAQNILEMNFFFRLGIISDLIHMVSFIFLGLLFYKIFRSINQTYAMALVSIVLVTNAIMGFNLLNQWAAMQLLNQPSMLSSFSKQQVEAWAMFFLDLHITGIHMGYIFFGLWLWPLSILMRKSGFFPGYLGKLISLLLMAGCIGYLIDFTTYFLFHDHYRYVAPFATLSADIGEILLCLWLLVKGTAGNLRDRKAFAMINQKA
ncbi:MAG: DUF4386 domain-containing protein [Candidatus Cyclobacteriaceae bacterium M3_2C_046]